MEQSIKKFLEFNEKKVYFKSAEGVWWIAIKPICEALSVNYDRQFKNIKASKIFGQLYAIQHIVAGDGRLREMICLPERVIYGWLFKLDSTSPGFESYQLKCNDLLFNYFHGTITERTFALKTKTKLDLEIEKTAEAVDQLPDVIKYKALIAQKNQVTKALKKYDEDFITAQLPLWESEKEEIPIS